MISSMVDMSADFIGCDIKIIMPTIIRSVSVLEIAKIGNCNTFRPSVWFSLCSLLKDIVA